MADHEEQDSGAGAPKDDIPLGQRLFDSPFLLLIAALSLLFLRFSSATRKLSRMLSRNLGSSADSGHGVGTAGPNAR